MITLEEFLTSVKVKIKPSGLSTDLEALWEDGIGDWEKSHDIAQMPSTKNGDRIHAYLHRKEGDQFNASYWYRRCKIDLPTSSLEEEWIQLVKEFLK